MTRNISDRQGLYKAEQKFLSDIEEHGWNVTEVFAAEGDEGPEWCFSCGLFFTHQRPEIIIFGLARDTMTKIINEIGLQIRDGARFEPGKEYSNIFQNCRCSFRPVREDHYQDYLGWAIWFYEQDRFPVLQCFWPDQQDFYPWDTRCNTEVRYRQPLLFEPSPSQPVS